MSKKSWYLVVVSFVVFNFSLAVVEGGTWSQTTQKVITTQADNLIVYWPLWETSGTTIDNYEGTAARDGTYSSVTLGETGIGDGKTSPRFDGTNDYCAIHTTSLQSAFNGAEGEPSRCGSRSRTLGFGLIVLPIWPYVWALVVAPMRSVWQRIIATSLRCGIGQEMYLRYRPSPHLTLDGFMRRLRGVPQQTK